MSHHLRQIRIAAGVSQLTVAAEARVALATVCKYELDPGAVLPTKRRVLDPIYERLSQENAAPPAA